MEMPSILLVGNHLSGSGWNPGVCESLAWRLGERGWRVITTSDRPEPAPRLCDMLATAWKFRHEYDVAHVDVYSGRAFLWAEAVGHLLRMAGKPYAVTLRGGNLASFADRWPGRVARLLTGAVAVTTPSQFLMERFASEHAHVWLLPNPVDVRAYRYRARTPAEPRLVWLRAFHQIYEPELAVRVVAELVGEFPKIHLTMAGPDKDGSLGRAKLLAMRHGLAERIRFPGPVVKAALPDLLDAGDVFLNTARIDNAPVSVLEAMAGGLCIASTKAGGIPHLLRHESEALLTPCGSARQMAGSVRRVLLEPELAGRLSRNARRRAEQHEWSKVLPQWERLFHMAAAMTGSRGGIAA